MASLRLLVVPVSALLCFACLKDEEALPVDELKQCIESGAVAKVSADSVPVDSSTDSPKKPLVILPLKGYPPVAGMNPSDSVPPLVISNPRPETDPLNGGTNTNVGWIEPVGFDSSNARLLPCLSLFQVTAQESYHASNVILDADCKVVRNFEYKHEVGGAPTNSYLVWDMKDASGSYVKPGRYYWNVGIESRSGKEVHRTRIEATRTASCPLP